MNKEELTILERTIIGGYRVERKLDSQSKNSLYIVTKENEENDHMYIMKVLPYETEKEICNFKQEENIINLLKNNPLFVKYEDQFEYTIDVASEDSNGQIIEKKKKFMFIIMKYYEYNDLRTLAEKNPKGADEQLVIDFMFQSLNALVVLSKHRIIHHDIKLANFLIASTNPWKFILIDFEFAIKLNDDIDGTSSGDGTLIFMSPEVLKEEPHDMSADIWGIGVSAFRLATGVYPYKITMKDDIKNIIHKIDENNPIILHSRFKNKSPELKNLLLKMLEKDQNSRITAEEALESPLFNKYCYQMENEEDCQLDVKTSFTN